MDRIERRRKSRGQAMVEFALLASLLFLLVMGIFDFGRAISVYINIAEAAHDVVLGGKLQELFLAAHP